jgi:hypothetical protein
MAWCRAELPLLIFHRLPAQCSPCSFVVRSSQAMATALTLCTKLSRAAEWMKNVCLATSYMITATRRLYIAEAQKTAKTGHFGVAWPLCPHLASRHWPADHGPPWAPTTHAAAAPGPPRKSGAWFGAVLLWCSNAGPSQQPACPSGFTCALAFKYHRSCEQQSSPHSLVSYWSRGNCTAANSAGLEVSSVA